MSTTNLWKFNAYKKVAANIAEAKSLIESRNLVYGEPSIVPYLDSSAIRYVIGIGGIDGSTCFVEDSSVLLDELNKKANKDELATVATTGNYSDLNGTPAIDSSITTQSTNENTAGSKAVYDLVSTVKNDASLGAAAYQKISNGLVESDLAQSVKDKLNYTEIFAAVYNPWEPTSSTPYNDVLDAHNAGKTIVCKVADTGGYKFFPLVWVTTGEEPDFYFYGTDVEGDKEQKEYRCFTGGWESID